MKRVYCVFEDCYANNGYQDHEDVFIDVYDNYQAAIRSVHEWADSFYATDKVVGRVSDRMMEEVQILDSDDPYSNDTKIMFHRYIKSTLLKSS